MKNVFVLILSLISLSGQAQIPDDGGSISSDCDCIDYWGTDVTVTRGFVNISDKEYEYQDDNKASFGEVKNAEGSNVNSSLDAISLGDSGVAVYYFKNAITNSIGPELAIFENSQIDGFLELAFVEVSEDGVDFVRFPAVSNTQTDTQVSSFGALEADSLYNLAGKYLLGEGTPFDLSDLEDSLIDLDNVHYVKIVDAVGDVKKGFGSEDVNGNLVNDPFPTPYHSAGFDLSGIAILKGLETGLFSVDDNNVLAVFPNPTTGLVRFTKNVSGNVYDARGESVVSFENRLELQLSDLVSGIYLIKTKKGQSQKVILK